MANSTNSVSIPTTPSILEQDLSCLHISGLPFETTEEDILILLKDFGVKSVKVFK